MRRILVYSHDTFGLGNIRRMLEISRFLVDRQADRSILVISGSPMLHAFRIPPRIDYIKLPCLSRGLDGSYGVKFLDLAYDQAIRLRSNLITSTILDFAPELILVDKKPFGVDNELAPALDLLRRRGCGCRMVLLLRDILDDPSVTRQVWERNGYHEAIETYYDLVLVVGARHVFDTVAEYGFPQGSGAKVRFCGYIGRDRPGGARRDVRTELGVGDGPLVLVTAGGGEDGYQLLSCYIRGLRELAGTPPMKSLLVCGPELAGEERGRILAQSAGIDGLTVLEFSDDLMACMEAADLVVSMGGYNTVCELLSTRRRAIIVPRTQPVKEQWIRAARLARLGVCRCLHPAYLTPGELMAAVREELEASRVVQPLGFDQVDMGGLSRIEDCIGDLLAPGAVSVTAAGAGFEARRAEA